MALLPPEPGDLAHRHAFDAAAVQRLFDVVEFEMANDGFDFLHKSIQFSVFSFPFSVFNFHCGQRITEH
jgi:hypothetical protein